MVMEKMITVREFLMERDAIAVEEMELRCDVGDDGGAASDGENNSTSKKMMKKKKGGMSLIVDQMGDPMCRIRHTPQHLMLVAEYGGGEEEKEIVGVVRACIKVVTRGRSSDSAKTAYILGLRVSPTHRRLGIAMKLVTAAEEWCHRRGSEYAYMATDPGNAASLSLFTGKLGYSYFRSPIILVHPVHAHRLPLTPKPAAILRLPPPIAAALYRRIFSSYSEFFPLDEISAVVSCPLSIATFLALPNSHATWDPRSQDPLPASFAVASLWNCGGAFRLKLVGAPARARALLALARALDARAPWMRVPSVRDVTRPFGVCLMYGLHANGPDGAPLMRSLCRQAHNVAREIDPACAAVVAEVGSEDPVAAAVPHWRRFSCEDIWCMKRLAGAPAAGDRDDNWVKTPATTGTIFLDPRDF